MTLFDSLPVVENCCFCINLKLGCIIIAILGIIKSTGEITYFFLYTVACDSQGIFTRILKIFEYMSSVACILFLISSILFLVGIFINRSVIAMLFLYCTTLFILVLIGFLVFVILAMIFEKDCRVEVHLVNIILSIILWIYFVIVVRSYKDEMD